MSGDEQPKRQKPADREKLADKILEIFSDSPEDMKDLVNLLKKLEKNPVLHPDKESRDSSRKKGKGKKQHT